MEIALYAAAALTVAIGIAHSYLGERYILVRLFRREDLPRLFGGTEYTRNTLRFAWHLTTIAWVGLAAILVQLAHPPVEVATVGLVVGGTFLLHAVVALLGSRARHFSWPVFLIIGTLALWATRSG